MAGWNGVPPANVKSCLAMRTALTSGAGPQAHPIFHPVVLNDLPPEDTVTVRSAIPSRLATGMCRTPSKTRCSYTSSDTTIRSFLVATSATACSSSRVKTVPVGLCGELSRIIRVRGVTARRRSSSSKPKRPLLSGRSVTGERTAPANETHAAYVSNRGSKTMTSSPVSSMPRSAPAIASVAPMVTSTSVSGSWLRPQNLCWCSAIACRRSGKPVPGGYWFAPAAICSRAMRRTSAGPS